MRLRMSDLRLCVVLVAFERYLVGLGLPKHMSRAELILSRREGRSVGGSRFERVVVKSPQGSSLEW